MLIEQIIKLLMAISLYLVFTFFILIISLGIMENLIHQPVLDFKNFPFYKEFFPGLFAVLITLFVSFIGFLISNYLFKKIFPDKYIHFTINSILTFTKAIALFFILGLTTIIADYCIINWKESTNLESLTPLQIEENIFHVKGFCYLTSYLIAGNIYCLKYAFDLTENCENRKED